MVNVINPWEIYLLLKLDTFSDLFQAGIILAPSLLLLVMIVYHSTRSDVYESDMVKWEEKHMPPYLKIVKGLLITFVISCTLFVSLPTTKEACAIIGIPAVVNNEKVQEVATIGSEIVFGHSQIVLEEIKDATMAK